MKAAIEHAFRSEFPHDTVDVSDGYKDNIHVVVVSRVFDKMSEKQKHAVLWRLLDESDLTAAEKRLISLLYPVSPGELK